jgi:Uma2 family endonuclease
MTAGHNRTMVRLTIDLGQQLDQRAFDIRCNSGHVRSSPQGYYIPDVAVIPIELVEPQLGKRALGYYTDPLPLVVEVWSPSTGDYDIREKFAEYRRRGDLDIWRIHPFERTLTAWRRQPDGSYSETTYTGGSVQPAPLPGITIDLDRLFE